MKQATNKLFDTFTISSIINLVRNQSVSDWRPDTFYSVGDQVRVYYRKYVAINNGNSGISPPSHTTGIALRNQVQWLYIGFDSMSDLFANNVYLGLGMNDNNWHNNPDDVSLSDHDSSFTKNNLIALFKLSDNDVRIGIRRHEWEYNKRFSQYNPFIEQHEYSDPFYCIVGEDIYKCLSNNNNGFSRQAPTGRSINNIRQPDGYIWKYMGSIDSSDDIRFSTNDFVPIKRSVNAQQVGVELSAQPNSLSGFSEWITNNEPFTNPITRFIGTGTDADAHYVLDSSNRLFRLTLVDPGRDYYGNTFFVMHNDVPGNDATAVANITGGNISSINVINSGFNYTHAIALIVGDGSGATADVNVNTVTGGIEDITVTSVGYGYTWAEVFILPGTAGLATRCIPAPSMGHGYDIVRELHANVLLLSKGVSASMQPYIINTNYNEASILTTVKTDKEADAMAIAPKHPAYNTPTNLNKYHRGSGDVIYKTHLNTINYNVSSTQSIILKLNVVFEGCDVIVRSAPSTTPPPPTTTTHNITPNGITTSFSVNDTTSSELVCTLPENIQIGDPIAGGYFAGIIDTTQGNIHSNDIYQNGEKYALILSPKSLEHYAGTWNNTRSDDIFARSRWNGLGITNSIPSSGAYAALRYVKGLTADSYPCTSDWYLPAMDELELIYRNFKPTADENSTNTNTGLFPGTQQSGDNPSTGDSPYTISNPLQTTLAEFQEGGSQALDQRGYWSATCVTNDGSAWTQDFNQDWLPEQGEQSPRWKNTANFYVRPVRRITLG